MMKNLQEKLAPLQPIRRDSWLSALPLQREYSSLTPSPNILLTFHQK
jgi:hypothetical protein